ncbi:mRNA N(3)-methylcytidine methyltransferase METTL8 isoform X3 [Pangasianodon hypophthalmus]|uniref:mRNA N(3)-methylcytidine methyltransferase METTL8 isoform X3 n=1 Tax=Pangasianodon hypophthalmus TaxID=310915 RepID=UPI002307CAEE|nr:mRNA N(3)-methylcytidine methyltransferase METTL8 isoform X3 [Pangasianodon hypophthalmus]XP_053090066.1 mRNA N(3)-methylcytidine methyltransferase METTL8 isoform X3 [Pangasianodon hypophthalmus]
MRRLLKMTVLAVVRGVGHVPCRCLGGRPPAPLGGRILTNPKDIFQHNMWDHVQWSPEEMEEARQKAEENSREQIPIEEQVRYDRDANKYWDRFYEMHQNKFFKNRQWLFSEFPELLPQGCDTSRTPEGQEASAPAYPELRETQHSRLESQKGDDHIPNHDVLREKQHTDYLSAVHSQEAAAFPGQHASFRILEVGCGAGNSVFPIINAIRGSDAFLYCFDFSSRAIQLVKEHPDYDPAVCHAFVQDICDDVSMFPFPQESLDVIVVVFVLSSIHPESRMQRVLNRLASYLKHGGTILFRDYGRYDLAQLRFKKGQCLSENFYTRQDGTCVYFFMKDEVHQLFTNAGLEEVQNLEDRRLQVNRGKKVVMHRVWMQSKYRKPSRVPIS